MYELQELRLKIQEQDYVSALRIVDELEEIFKMVNSTFDNNEVYSFKDNLSLTFSDYFSLRVTEAEIAQHFGYKFSREYLDLPVAESNMAEEISLKAKATSSAIASILPYVNLDNEIARSEILISPFMFAAIALAKSQLNIEYYLDVDSQLKGTVDYYLHSSTNQILALHSCGMIVNEED